MTKTNNSAAKFLSARIVAIRAELVEVKADSRGFARLQERALERDLLVLEKRLAEVI